MGFMEGPGMEQNSAMLGQTDPQDHPAPQAAPSAHSPSSGAIATLTGAATEPGWLQEQENRLELPGKPLRVILYPGGLQAG